MVSRFNKVCPILWSSQEIIASRQTAECLKPVRDLDFIMTNTSIACLQTHGATNSLFLADQERRAMTAASGRFTPPLTFCCAARIVLQAGHQSFK